jgi:hypothetical protein
MVDEHEGEFVSADWDAVAEGDINVDNVEVFGWEPINGFTARCLGNGCVGSKWEGELTGVGEDTAIGCGDDMLVILKTMATGEAMELLWSKCLFWVGRVRGVAWSDGWKARLRVVEVGSDILLRHAFEFFGRPLYISGICWSSRVVILDVWRGGGSVFETVDESNQLVAIKIPQTSQEGRGWDDQQIIGWRRQRRELLWPVGQVWRHDVVIVVFIFNNCRGRRHHGDSSGSRWRRRLDGLNVVEFVDEVECPIGS